MYSLKTKLHLLLAFIVLFIGLSVLALMDTAAADETGTRAEFISHTPTDINISASGTTTEYISPEFTAQFPFNGIGLVWTGAETAAVQFALQVDSGSWHDVEMMGDEAKDTAEFFTSIPLFITGQTVRYKITGQTEAVQNVRLIYFDSTVPPYRSVLSRLLSMKSTNVVTREQWGADESYRFWEPDYQTPEKIVIHHTAGGNGNDNPMATIRGIYYWHAMILGWGDIGYNYLIDPAGTVYEGRYGGDGAGGAHTYNSETDTNYNQGSIGVGLLGCYEDTAGACATVNSVTTAMQQALVDLTAEKSNQFGFDPAGTSTWFGEDLPNVLTHRDLDATYCPGSSIYSLLDTIRSTAGSEYTNTRRYQAMFAGTDLVEEYTLTDTLTITVQYANVGRKTWKRDDVVMQVRLNETGERNRVTLDSDVTADATVSLITTATLPDTPGDYTLTTRLYRSGQPIRGSKHTYTFTMANPYAVKVINTQLPIAIKTGWIPTLQLLVRNSGSVSLPAETVFELNGKTIYSTTKRWPVGEKRDISINLDQASQWPAGLNTLIFKMKVADVTVSQSRTVLVIRVDE